MRRTLPGIAGTAALALVLAACGGELGERQQHGLELLRRHRPHRRSRPSSPGGTPPTPPTRARPTRPSSTKFNEEYPNVTINYESVPFGEAQNKFKTAAEAGSGAPDIMRAEVAWVPEFAAAGHLYALDGTALLEDNNFLETPLSSNVYDGKTYGVPQVTDTLGLMYNKELFEKAGITEAPTTWEEVDEAAQAAQGEGQGRRPLHQQRWLLPAPLHLRRGW